MTLKELLEKRASVWKQMQDIMARADKDGLKAEDRAQYDQLHAELRDLTSDKERREAHEDLERRLAEPAGGPPPITDPTPGESRTDAADKAYREAFSGYIRYGMAGLEPEQRRALQQGFVSGPELRAQGVGTTTAGGYFVPQGFRQRLQEAMKWYGGIIGNVEVIETDTGATLPWPTNDDTGNVGAILAENTQVSEQDVTIGQKTLSAYMYTSKLVRVSLQLLQDSAFDVEVWLPRKLGERIGRILNTHFTTGTGSSQPLGIQTNATVGITGATSATPVVAYGNILSLVYSIDPAYRNAGRAKFMMNDATIGAIRGLLDSQNRPLWEPSIQVGQPDALLGYPIIPNNDMPVMAADAKSILFGDFFAGYVARLVTGVQSIRLDERYADYLQVGFLAFQRADGTTQDATAYKAYKNGPAS